jgi:hypothetical protein
LIDSLSKSYFRWAKAFLFVNQALDAQTTRPPHPLDGLEHVEDKTAVPALSLLKVAVGNSSAMIRTSLAYPVLVMWTGPAFQYGLKFLVYFLDLSSVLDVKKLFVLTTQ